MSLFFRFFEQQQKCVPSFRREREREKERKKERERERERKKEREREDEVGVTNVR